MARKNPFANLMDDHEDEKRPVLDYTVKGASKSIISSIDEIAARADKLLEGQTVVDIEPGLIDQSFVRDRLEEDLQDYQDLMNAIRDHGQESPILLRPHPKAIGRYMVVFGHRRLKIAKALGRKVRAVIREMDDQAHVVAQGQENSARANLSFIEKAMFAGTLSRLNYDGDHQTVMAALSIDRATLSKMLSVVSIPDVILEAVGPARGVGRDRWYELKLLIEKPSERARALAYVADPGFLEANSSDERFNRLLSHLKAGKRSRVTKPVQSRQWASSDRRVAADMRSDGKNFTLALKAKDGAAFGEFLSAQLASLYAAYLQQGEKQQDQGD